MSDFHRQSEFETIVNAVYLEQIGKNILLFSTVINSHFSPL
jgi:hypothetical protein